MGAAELPVGKMSYEIHSNVFRTLYCEKYGGSDGTKIVVLINRPRGNPSRAPHWAIARGRPSHRWRAMDASHAAKALAIRPALFSS